MNLKLGLGFVQSQISAKTVSLTDKFRHIV